MGAMDYVLAQVNIGRLLAPIDSPLIADFVAALDSVNAMADAAPGFVWRMVTEDGNALAVRGFEQDGVGSGGGIIINMSVWESVETLAAYAYGDAHIAILRRRREWFERMRDALKDVSPGPTFGQIPNSATIQRMDAYPMPRQRSNSPTQF